MHAWYREASFMICLNKSEEVAKPTSNLHVDHVGAVCKRGGREAATSATNRCRPGRQSHFATRRGGTESKDLSQDSSTIRNPHMIYPFSRSLFFLHLISAESYATSSSRKDVLAQELGILRPGGPSADLRGAKVMRLDLSFATFQGRIWSCQMQKQPKWPRPKSVEHIQRDDVGCVHFGHASINRICCKKCAKWHTNNTNDYGDIIADSQRFLRCCFEVGRELEDTAKHIHMQHTTWVDKHALQQLRRVQCCIKRTGVTL